MHYALISANDAPERDPKDWTLCGLQRRPDLDDARHADRPGLRRALPDQGVPRSTNDHRLPHYRLDITAQPRRGIVQLAELQLSNGDTAPPPPSDMTQQGRQRAAQRLHREDQRRLHRREGARSTPARTTAEGRGYSYNKVFDVDVPVTADAPSCRYLIFPEFVDDDLSYPSTYAAVDLAFTDGTYLSDLGADDQHGATLSPQGQGASKTLYTNQWNYKVSRIGAVAAGKTIDRILVAYDNPDGPAEFGGWIDDIRIDGRPAAEAALAAVRLGRDHPRHELDRQLLARQQHPRDGGPARLQLLDAGDERRLAELALRVPPRQQRGRTCRRCRRSPPATSRARGWATGRRSR